MAYRKFIALEICSTTAQRTIIRKHITVCFLKDEYVRLFLMEKIKVRNAFVNDAGLIKARHALSQKSVEILANDCCLKQYT